MTQFRAGDDLAAFVVGRDSVLPADRSQVWASWCGVDSYKTQFGNQYYASLIAQSSTNEQRHKIPDASTIEADVSRTYSSNEAHVLTINGVAGTDACEVVRRMLYALALHGREKNGYVQGMNYIAANCLDVTLDEELSYWLTVAITEEVLNGYFDQQLRQFQVDSKAFRSLVRGSKQIP